MGQSQVPISNINEVQVNGVAGTTAEFQQDISTVILTLNNGGTADLKGSLTTTNDVEFNGGGGILQFSGTNPNGYSFNSAVTNGQNGTLNAYTNLTSTDASIGTIKTINIGQLGTPNALNIVVNQPALSLLAAGGSISFNDPGSTLNILPGQAQTITFNGNLDGTTGTGGGILNFDATNGDLTLQGATGVETVGTTNQLKAINLVGANTITLLGGDNQLSFKNGAAALTIGGGTTFIDQSTTSSNIGSITIGTTAAAGTYVLDAVNNNFTLTAGLTFGNQDSVLQLQTSIGTNASSTITLGGDINPGTANTGKIEISSVNAGATLTINGVYNVGIAGGNTVQSIDFSGAGSMIMTDPILNPNASITTSVAALQLGTVGVTFDTPTTTPTNLTVNSIAGTTDFAGQAGAVVLTDGGSLATVMSSKATAGLLAIAGNGTITGTVNNINQIQVNGIGGTTAKFQQNVSVASVLFSNGGTADFKGSLNTDPTGNINFGPNPNGGILQFSGTDPNGYELSSVIENGGNGTLNVFTNLKAIEPSIGTIQTIAIGRVSERLCKYDFAICPIL